jgi:hypothetical protein
MSFPENMINQSGIATADNAADDAVETAQIDLDEKVEVADSTKDFNIVPPPPPAGEVVIQWELSEKGVVPARSAKVGQFLNVYLTGHIIMPNTEYDGYTVSEYMNSIYNKLKGTSEVHDFMNKLGSPVPNSTTLRDLKTHIEKALAPKPVGTAELEWKVTERNPGDKRANKDGYVTIKNKMSQFSKLPDGSGYQNFVESSIDGDKIYAQAYISKHLRK